MSATGGSLTVRLCLLTTEVSPHQISLARSFALLTGPDGFRYVAVGEISEERRRLGWDVRSDCDGWILEPQRGGRKLAEARCWTEEADVLSLAFAISD
jgi:hypothetical protein